VLMLDLTREGNKLGQLNTRDLKVVTQATHPCWVKSDEVGAVLGNFVVRVEAAN
jgi:hypothetical protein